MPSAPLSPLTVAFPTGFIPNGKPLTWTTIKKPADETRAAIVAADDASLQFAVSAGITYAIRAMLVSTQTRDDIGANVIFSNLAMTWAMWVAYVNRIRTAGGSVGVSTDANWFTRDKFGALSDAAPWNPTGGATLAACQNTYLINGLIRPSAGGVFALRWWTSSAAGPVTLKAGSFLEVAPVAT